uniref:Uncharacterized protein n=1 Tax=Picea glauca TaxID=3330 RepID=A0A101M044_PICGL|nr:hypothetical protein ABT39_MTgene4519 [Picea glauca]QHR86691.1 hypothetical protein Q903MT_gene695 [Picea sitchensis]
MHSDMVIKSHKWWLNSIIQCIVCITITPLDVFLFYNYIAQGCPADPSPMNQTVLDRNSGRHE